MKSQTSLIAQQTRLSEWAEQIRECNNRPSGMTVGDWCRNQGITKANYYWRLRKVREALLEAADSTPAFVELKEPVAELFPAKSQETSTVTVPKIMAIVKKEHCSIEITDQASSDFLNTLLRVLNHA